MNKETDRNHIWHPYTSISHPRPVDAVASTSGTHIYLEDGTPLIDGISSWWCAAHGYCRPEIVHAIQEQVAKMPHVMFGGLTHGPAIDLATRLLKILPAGLEKIFYADSGSIAVECAIKMALQYQNAVGRPGRTRIAALLGGYHGDTIGAMSVSDPEEMHSIFRGVLPRQFFVPSPQCRFDEPWREEAFEPMRELLANHSDEIAGVILEPVFQGANAMWFYHPEYLRRLRQECDRHDIVLIFDEIATGFGRTGERFACLHAGVTPDVMCVGKALTAGAITMACAITTKRISDPIPVFLHGPTYMGNPLACAAACASLDLFESYDWKANVKRIEKKLKELLPKYRSLPNVQDVRALGAVGVLDVKKIPDEEQVRRIVLETGVWLRPESHFIYTMPPFVTTDEEIERIVDAMGRMAAIQ